MGNEVQDILKAFTWRFVHDVLKSRKFLNPVTNRATVDVADVITSIPLRPCKHGLYPQGYSESVYVGLLMVTYIIRRGL